jgi:hypothetical protein
MPTITTGVFFVTKQLPIAAVVGETFTLTMHLYDRLSPHAVEPYVVRWVGNYARTWWDEHHRRIQAGTPLRLVLHNPRSFPGARAPETHALVHTCELAPLAPSWQTQAEPAPEPTRARPA